MASVHNSMRFPEQQHGQAQSYAHFGACPDQSWQQMDSGCQWGAVWPVQFYIPQPQQPQQPQQQLPASAGAGHRQQQLLQRQLQELQELQELQQMQHEQSRSRRPDRKAKVPALQLPQSRRNQNMQPQQPQCQTSLFISGDVWEKTGEDTDAPSSSSNDGKQAIESMETLDSLPSLYFPPTPESTPSNSPRWGISTLDSLPESFILSEPAVFRLPAQKNVNKPKAMQTYMTAPPMGRAPQNQSLEAQWGSRHSEAECHALLQQLGSSDADERKKAIEMVTESAWTLAITSEGCRVVQQALGMASIAEQVEMAHKLKGKVLEASTCPNANHVLQKCVELVPAENLQFILEEMSGQVVTTARHRYGCRVLERLIERAWHTESLVDEVLADTSLLCRHPFGNFVVQHVLKLGTPLQRRSVVEILHTDIQRLARHRVASHVVRGALANGSSEDRQRLVSALTMDPAGFADLAHHHCGSYVVREMRKEKQRR